MISGEIRDWQITASSTFWDPDCHEKNARLYQPSDRAWCARHKSDSEWLQIDLGIAAKVRLTLVFIHRSDHYNRLVDIWCIDARSIE